MESRYGALGQERQAAMVPPHQRAMATRKRTQTAPVAPVKASVDTETFRSARLALSQISADLERLRRHATSLVKNPSRAAK